MNYMNSVFRYNIFITPRFWYTAFNLKYSVHKNTSGEKSYSSEKAPGLLRVYWENSHQSHRTKIHQKLPIKLGKRFAQPETSEKPKIEAKKCLIFFSKIMSSVSGIGPKIPRSPLCSQNVLFLVKVEEGFDQTNYKKTRIVPKKVKRGPLLFPLFLQA